MARTTQRPALGVTARPPVRTDTMKRPTRPRTRLAPEPLEDRANPVSFGPADGYWAGSNVMSVAVGDLNGDGHPDVVLVCMFNDWRRKGAASVVWLENDGKGNFTPWQIADAPSHLATSPSATSTATAGPS